jgi:hypothetical protein
LPPDRSCHLSTSAHGKSTGEVRHHSRLIPAPPTRLLFQTYWQQCFLSGFRLLQRRSLNLVPWGPRNTHVSPRESRRPFSLAALPNPGQVLLLPSCLKQPPHKSSAIIFANSFLSPRAVFSPLGLAALNRVPSDWTDSVPVTLNQGDAEISTPPACLVFGNGRNYPCNDARVSITAFCTRQYLNCRRRRKSGPLWRLRVYRCSGCALRYPG